jgi:multidrug efflux pump subunit AcrA (membrane-fusion protein)
LELQRTDLDIARTHIDLLAAETSMESSNNSTPDIRADYQGVVISAEKSSGQFVAQGERIATIGVNNNIFICDIFSSEPEGRFIEIGDEANIRGSGSASIIKAIVYDIEPEGDTLKISLVFETEEFNGGEYITVNFKKQTDVYLTIVPNEAIFREGTGSFVWVIGSRQGALGIEYFTSKVRVIIADSDEYYTAISKGLAYVAPVVISQSKDLSVNGRVNRME